MTTPASARKPFDFTKPSNKTAIESMGHQNKRALQLKGARSSKNSKVKREPPFKLLLVLPPREI